MSRDPSPELPGEPIAPIKLEPEDDLKLEAINSAPSFPSAESLATTTVTDLSVFEKWVVLRLRSSQNDGISFAEGLRKLQQRCDFLEGQAHHYRRLFAEIHALSRDLE